MNRSETRVRSGEEDDVELVMLDDGAGAEGEPHTTNEAVSESDSIKILSKAMKKAAEAQRLLEFAMRKLAQQTQAEKSRKERKRTEKKKKQKKNNGGGKKHSGRKEQQDAGNSSSSSSSSSSTSSSSTSTESEGEDSPTMNITELDTGRLDLHGKHCRRGLHHGGHVYVRRHHMNRSRSHSRGRSRDRSRGHSRGHSRGRSRGHSRGHSHGRSRVHSRERSLTRMHRGGPFASGHMSDLAQFFHGGCLRHGRRHLRPLACSRSHSRSACRSHSGLRRRCEANQCGGKRHEHKHGHKHGQRHGPKHGHGHGHRCRVSRSRSRSGSRGPGDLAGIWPSLGHHHPGRHYHPGMMPFASGPFGPHFGRMGFPSGPFHNGRGSRGGHHHHRGERHHHPLSGEQFMNPWINRQWRGGPFERAWSCPQH